MVTLPAFTVREVVLIGISLPFKGNGTISLMAVFEDNQPDKPFNNIQQVEKYIEHFLHLLGMYLLMIEGYVTNLLVSPCEENPEEVHKSEASRGMILFLTIFIHLLYWWSVYYKTATS